MRLGVCIDVLFVVAASLPIGAILASSENRDQPGPIQARWDFEIEKTFPESPEGEETSRVDLRDCGLIGDGETWNSPKELQRCVERAIEAGKSLYVPTGTFRVRFTPQLRAIRIRSNLTVIGADQTSSIVRFGPDEPPFFYVGFEAAAGTRVAFEELTIGGPENGLLETKLSVSGEAGSTVLKVTSGSPDKKDIGRIIHIEGETKTLNVIAFDPAQRTYTLNSPVENTLSTKSAVIFRTPPATRGIRHLGGTIDTVQADVQLGDSVLWGPFTAMQEGSIVRIRNGDAGGTDQVFKTRVKRLSRDGKSAILETSFPDSFEARQKPVVTVSSWSELRLNRVRITGEFWQAVEHNAGDGALVVRDSDITALVQGISSWARGDDDFLYDEKFVDVRDSRIHDLGIGKSGDGNEHPGLRNGHGMYIHPNIALHVGRTTFRQIRGKDCIAHYSSSGIPNSADLKYAVYENVDIDVDVRAILTSSNGPSQVLNSAINAGDEALNLRQDVRIRGSTISADGRVLWDHNAREGRVINVHVENSLLRAESGEVINVLRAGRGSVWRFSGTVISGSGSTELYSRTLVSFTRPGVSMIFDEESQIAALGSIEVSIYQSAGSLHLGEMTFRGSPSKGAVVLVNDAQEVELDGPRFLNSGANILNVNALDVWIHGWIREM